MLHEQLALERQGMRREIAKLQEKLQSIEANWAECARTGKSPCVFCANDDTCTSTNDSECHFVWQNH